MRDVLAAVSRSPASLGFTPTETAMFVRSPKEPLFSRLRRQLGDDVDALASEKAGRPGRQAAAAAPSVTMREPRE